jgi:ATP-binding cassette subfamily F protein uup
MYNGRSLHVVSWGKKFLFRPDQLETPVGQLSGGEQARILIAGLMRQPADILLLDEPTNDLDIASLDVLEASLLDFPGALVLVTHDRYLLDRVCHRLLGFGGNSGVTYYADYEQWLNDLPEVKTEERWKKSKGKTAKPPSQKNSRSNQNNQGRLSYLDQREYDQIEEIIAAEDNRLKQLQKKMELPEIVSNPEELAQCWQEVEAAQVEVERLYNRWDELEEKRMDEN